MKRRCYSTMICLLFVLFAPLFGMLSSEARLHVAYERFLPAESNVDYCKVLNDKFNQIFPFWYVRWHGVDAESIVELLRYGSGGFTHEESAAATKNAQHFAFWLNSYFNPETALTEDDTHKFLNETRDFIFLWIVGYIEHWEQQHGYGSASDQKDPQFEE